jgi:hypothetical protein
MSVGCNNDNSFVPATTNRTSQFQNLVNFPLFIAYPLNSALKLPKLPSGNFNISGIHTVVLYNLSEMEMYIPSNTTI